jgi:hypothetical protein
VSLGASSIDLTYNVGHTSLVAHEGSEMWLLSSIVTWKAAYLTTMVFRALLWQKAKGATT